MTGKVENGYFSLFVVADASECPSARVASHVVERADKVFAEDYLQGFGERGIAVEVVEGEPTPLHIRGQRGQPLVDGRPVAKVFQSGRLSLFDGFLEAEQTHVVDIVYEVNVRLRCGIIQEEPSRLGDGVAVGFCVDEHRADAERRLEQTLDGILRESDLLGNLSYRKPVVAVAQKGEDAELEHQARSLEDDRPPGNELSLSLSLASREGVSGVLLL